MAHWLACPAIGVGQARQTFRLAIPTAPCPAPRTCHSAPSGWRFDHAAGNATRAKLGGVGESGTDGDGDATSRRQPPGRASTGAVRPRGPRQTANVPGCESPLGRDPAGAAHGSRPAHSRPRVPPFARAAFTGVVACGPGVATWAQPLAAIRQVLPVPPPWPAVRPCRVHGRKSRLWPNGPASRRGRRSRLAAIRQVPPFPPRVPPFARVAFTGGSCGLWPAAGVATWA